ncbi:DEAD/DEAH box helicase [soil metagenome]
MPERAGRELTDALERFDELRAENARLRGLLGLDDRSNDGHIVAWEPTLFGQSRDRAAVDASSSSEEKLALMRALFGARSDVFAMRWENQSTAKAGWSPALSRGWSSRKHSPKDYLPLSDEALTRHLRGEATIGIYPLLGGDGCTLLACDFDGTSWALDSLAYLDACHETGVPAALERSRSGDGAHVWVFFDGPVEAATARSLGASLLRMAMTARAEMDLASYDRFFPSQDFMPKGSFGNLIALPLQGECLARGTTAFLDPTTMEPWPDQWAFLSSVARLSPPAVQTLADALRPVDAGPASTLWDLAKERPELAEVVTARMGAGLAIERIGVPPSVIAAFKHLASIHNPVFYEKQRMRFSTWDTPRFIRCYDEDLSWLHLPRGLTERVSELVAELGSRLEVFDDRPVHEPLDLQFKSVLRAQQQDAVEAVIPHDRGVIVAPPGSGKTVMACAVIAERNVPTLVLVDRKPLLEQWSDRLEENLGLDHHQIGKIGGGKTTQTGVVDVAMIQSLTRRDDLHDFFANYGLVVVDECHHLPAVSFERCVKQAPVRHWLGLTATPYRRDGLEGIIALQCGPTRHEIAPAAAQDAALLRRDVIVHDTATRIENADLGIQQIFAGLVDDDTRTNQICGDVDPSLQSGRTCLVLTQRVEHIERLAQRLAALGHEPLVLHGSLGQKTRNAVTAAIDERQDGDGIVLIATGSYLGEGFDWPELDTLFLAFPIAFKGRVVQYVGRLLRSHEGKHHVELHDYVDVDIPVLDRMHTKRLPAYRTLGFEIHGQGSTTSRRHSQPQKSAT